MAINDNPGNEDGNCTLVRHPSIGRKHMAADVAQYVVVVEGTERGKKFELGLKPVSVGRRADNHFVLADPFISGHHCVITFENGQTWVTDLGSSNGSFIDEQGIQQKAIWPADATLQIGNQILRREYYRRENIQRFDELAKDLSHAARYVRTLLPQPVCDKSITTAWHFEPSAELGGDIFDYFWLDAEHFVFYLLDVCGHGIGAALHSISVFNLLRQQSLPAVNFAQPKQVLKALNDALPMNRYGDMYFTVWYGVYHPLTTTLTFAAAGHPPALLFYGHRKQCIDLAAKNAPIGIIPDVEFQEKTITLCPNGWIYLYSDGAYDITTKTGAMWSWDDFVQLMQKQLQDGNGQPELICQAIRNLAKKDHFEDDFSLVLLNFSKNLQHL